MVNRKPGQVSSDPNEEDRIQRELFEKYRGKPGGNGIEVICGQCGKIHNGNTSCNAS